LAAQGGFGGFITRFSSGFGGGGGRIVILNEPGGFSGSGTINVSGGSSGGAPGQVTFGVIPEPTSLNLLFLGLGSIALLDYAWRRRKRVSTPQD
jgi:hypothetical protein